jgi:hypothetical protein
MRHCFRNSRGRFQDRVVPSHGRLRKAEVLAEANRERRQAEEIHLATQLVVEQEIQALADLATGQQPKAQAEDNPAESERAASAAEERGWRRCTSSTTSWRHPMPRLEAQAAELTELCEQFGLTEAQLEYEEDGPQVVRGELVDDADTPPRRPSARG